MDQWEEPLKWLIIWVRNLLFENKALVHFSSEMSAAPTATVEHRDKINKHLMKRDLLAALMLSCTCSIKAARAQPERHVALGAARTASERFEGPGAEGSSSVVSGELLLYLIGTTQM